MVSSDHLEKMEKMKRCDWVVQRRVLVWSVWKKDGCLEGEEEKKEVGLVMTRNEWQVNRKWVISTAQNGRHIFFLSPFFAKNPLNQGSIDFSLLLFSRWM